MSSSAWCDLNSNGNILKLHDKCPNPKCNCQKINTFTPNQNMLEGGSIKRKLKSVFKGTKTAWDKFLKPALNMASPYIGMALAAVLKPLTGGKILSLTDMHGRGLRLKVM